MGKLKYSDGLRVSVNGIKKRWILNALILSSGFFILIVILFSFLIKGYFYHGLEKELCGRFEEMSKIFSLIPDIGTEEFENFSKIYIEKSCKNDENLQILICDRKDKIITSVHGTLNKNYNFFKNGHIKNSKLTAETWTEYLPSGEHVMTSTGDIFTKSGIYIGSVKYVFFLKNIDKFIICSIIILIFLGTISIILITFFAARFIKSIINPVMEISKIAKLIARGNFSIKIMKKYNDEIGELCDTINYMAEELGNAEKIKNDFISSVSHEIRTPLTAIKGWAETMNIGDGIDKSVIKKGLNIIVHETERLSKIVEELLDFSSLQSGIMAVSMERLDVLAELGEAVYIFKERAAFENKALVYNEPKMVSPIMGDRNRLKQVFINVIDNALKYTSEGGGISVSVTEKNSQVCISVTDTGCGISKSHLPRVTEKFYKANSTQGGSGIGLAIVSEIIEIHRGTLEIISEEGFGTTVNIFLPVIKQIPDSLPSKSEEQ